MNALSQNISSYLRRMEDEIDALRCDDVFSASVLAKEPAIGSEMSKRVETQKIITGYKLGFEPMIQTVLAKVTSPWASDETMRAATNVIKKAVTTNVSRYDEMFSLRLRRERTDFDFLSFMRSVFGDYQFIEKKLLFKTPTNLHKYKQLAAGIEDAIKAGEAFQQRQFDAVEAAKTQLQKLSP